ncbi:hypothetical protein NMY22_g8084 [Coprinellus aureogranulatus]|nr:hypothetical protein NMY22_g8084 [Coprinellus aureogranulatus]
MAKRQCEVEVDGGSLDEITNGAGMKRRRTTPKEEKPPKISVAAGKDKEDQDPNARGGKPQKDGKEKDTTAKGAGGEAHQNLKDALAGGERVATRQEEGGGKKVVETRKDGLPDESVEAPAKDEKAPDAVAPDPTTESPQASVTVQEGEPTQTSRRLRSGHKAPAGAKTKVATPGPEVPAKKSTRAGGRQKVPVIKLRDLCQAVLSLPHDVIYSVHSWALPPPYLVALRSANRLLKELLDSPSPWKAARKITYDAPDPPEGVAEWRWATVLWGNKCDLCGGRSDRLQEGIDFYVLRRHCNKCKWMDRTRTIAFPSTEIDKQYPGQPKELFDYVFHTPLHALLPLKDSTHKQYWHRDVQAVIVIWKRFQEEAGDEEKVAEFEEWKETRKKAIETRIANAKVYEVWKESVVETDQEARVHHLRSRLCDLGFKQVDVDAAITIQALESIRSPSILHIKDSAVVTAAEWKKFRPALEPLVEAKQAPRLRPLLDGDLSKKYLQHIMQQPPSEWWSYPPLEALAGSVALAYLLPDDPALESAAKQDLTPFLKVLHEPIDRYWGKKKDLVKQRLLGLNPGHRGYSRAHHELAKHIFVCNDLPEASESTNGRRNVTLCIGWRDVARHACFRDWDDLSTLNPPGLPREFRQHVLRHDNVLSSHAYALIKMVGQDPEKVTTAQMDELDPHYACRSEDPSLGYKVFSWRGALYHVLQDRNATFSPASDADAEKARGVADTFRELAPVWSCNRCSNNGALKTDTKSGLLKHLRSEHTVTPKAGKDYFLNQDLLHLCETGYQVSPESAVDGTKA